MENNNGEIEVRRAVTCFIVSKDGKILIEKRSQNRDLQPGENDLCSGHVKPDESDFDAMRREMREELGKSMEQYAGNLVSLKCIDLDFNKGGKRIRFLGHVYMLYIPKNSEDIEISIDESELSGFEWVPMEEVFNLIRSNQTRFPYTPIFEEIFSNIQKLFRTKEIENGEELNK